MTMSSRALRPAGVLVALLVALLPAAARADVGDYIGKPVTALAFETEGHRLSDSRLPPMVETQVNQPLTVAAVRASVTHLFSTGRYEDVRVHATGSPSGVEIVYELMPLHPVTGIAFTGIKSVGGIDEGRLRRAVADRFGATPRAARAVDIARLLEDQLHLMGYLEARAVPATDIEHTLEEATLRFDVEPGSRTHIGSVTVDGDAGIPKEELLDLLDVAPGAPYEPERLTTGITRYLENRRSHGFYAARAVISPVLTGETHLADLTITAAEGLHVRVVFNGDPLPSNRRNELVPVAAEGSVDEDLLEDSSIRIEEYLRAQGYRDAAAPYTSETQRAERVVTFTVKRGPQYRACGFAPASRSRRRCSTPIWPPSKTSIVATGTAR
jgi:outer membrane protein assembly factor BamA